MKAIQKLRLQNLPSLLTTKEVADLLQSSPLTIRRKALQGILQGYKIGQGQWRFKREDIWKQMNMETV